MHKPPWYRLASDPDLLNVSFCLMSACFCLAGRAVAVATDGINHFVSLSPDERAAMDASPLADLDSDWVNVGIESHPSKAADLVSDAKTLGIHFREGTHLLARAEKVWTLIEAVCDLSEGWRLRRMSWKF